MMKMNKLILLLTVLVTGLFFSSCIGDGSRDYTETSVAYIAVDNTTGKTFARTLTGKFIIANEMLLMQPGSFKFFTYSWNEDNGTTPIGDIQADNVIISGETIDIDRKSLYMTETPVQEGHESFVAIDPPYYVNNKEYLGDHWLFQYAYEAKKGETAIVDFYTIGDTEVGENKVTIDIQLTITGVPETGSFTTTTTDIIALDMAPIRALFEGTSQTNTKDLQITFQYYLKGYQEPVLSQINRLTVAGN